MLVPGNIGFSCLVLVLLSLPVVGFFVVRRKWRLALARGEKVRRLLVLASEEAARVELEASSVWHGAPARSYNPHPQCAVCFCPTTTRCARCKAVRYCSGKCQVIHWRQGHKEQCHPPSTNFQNNHKGSNFSLKAGKQKCANIHKAEGKGGVKPYRVPAQEPAFTNSTCSSESLYRGDDKKVKPLDNVLETNLISKSSQASGLDGFVSSAPSTESFYDASDIEISSSNHRERSDGHQYVDVSRDFPDTPSSINKKHQTQPVIREHTKLAGSAVSFTSSTVSRVDNTHSGSTVCTDPDFSGSVDGSFVEFSTASSGSRKSTSNKYPNTDDGRSSLHVGGGGNITSESGAFKRFSFNLSGYAIPALLDNSEFMPAAAALERKKSINGVASSENNIKGVSHDMNSQSLSSERYRHMELHPLSDSRLTSTSSFCDKRPKDVHGGNIPHLSMSREAGTATSNTPPSSDSGRNSVSGDKRGKVDDNHASAAILRYPQNVSNGLKTSALKVIDQIRPSVSAKQYPVGVGSEVSKRYGGKGLFPFDVFVKLYNWKEELQPCGLTNCGNSCFANVVLQCLAFTPTLTAYLLQRLHSKSCRKLAWCFSCEFERLILKMKEGKSPLSPIGILSRIGRISGHLRNGKEEDAHEFLRCVIDTMQSVCLKDAGVNESRAFGEETTLIGLTFGGYLRSMIKCMKCRGKSEQHERMMDLTVEIEGDIGSLEEALRKFTSTEILDGQNKYKCGRCKSYEKAKKKFTVLEAPNVLTIALKRFQSGKFGKLNKLIRFPEILDLAPYMSRASDKSPIYSLYGVVVHLDIMNAAFSGHYVCYVKNIQNKWFKIDDSTVKAVDREAVLTTKGAYILLYSRCSPREPKAIRNTVISDDARLKSPQGMKNSPSKSTLLHYGRMSSEGPFNADWVRRSSDVDFYSDTSSLLSGSDEGSCSTESSRDSTSTMDLSDYIFSDLGYGWNSPHRGSSDSDTSSPSSVLYSRRSSLADLDRYAECDGLGGISKRNSKEGGMGPLSRHLSSDTTIKQLRNVGSNSSSNRGANSGVPFRR